MLVSRYVTVFSLGVFDFKISPFGGGAGGPKAPPDLPIEQLFIRKSLIGRRVGRAARTVRAAIVIYIFSGSAGQAGTQRLKNMARTILLEDAQNQMRLLG